MASSAVVKPCGELVEYVRAGFDVLRPAHHPSGRKRVEVISRPIAHADDNTLVRFVDGTNVLFASEWVTVDRLPIESISPDEILLVKAVEAMDFEYFVPSHGKLAKKTDVTANIRYREELRDGVARAIAARRADALTGASHRVDGRLQRLGVLRAPASAERIGRWRHNVRGIVGRRRRPRRTSGDQGRRGRGSQSRRSLFT
jgi:hypothetical protein